MQLTLKLLVVLGQKKIVVMSTLANFLKKFSKNFYKAKLDSPRNFYIPENK